MLWFDFNNHDNLDVCSSMEIFMEKVAPHFYGDSSFVGNPD